MINRRNFLAGLAAGSAVSAVPALAHGSNSAFGINAESHGLRPGSPDDQGAVLQAILDKAEKSDMPVFLPPGRYRVSDVVLPENTRLGGIAGATRLEYTGGNHFLYAEKANHVSLKGLVLDGALMPYKDYAGGAIHVREAAHLDISDCHITNAALSGIQVDHSEGRISGNRIDSAIGTAGIFAVENRGLSVTDNLVEECANAGILVHRYTRGEDNTIVTNNRVRRISAVNGGTGQYGNGINIANADGVMIANNHISDCAYSTIRAFSSSNIQISNNTCLRAGETSIYSEFAFQGAMISGNVVDGGVRGISFANLNEGGRLSVCANNLIRNIHATPPYEDNQHVFGNGISAEADVAITGNVIENAANYGILLGWGEYLRNVTANANVIRKTRIGFYVSVVEGTGQVAITNNILSDITRGGIVGYRWKDPVTDDLARTGAGKYSNLEIANNRLNY
ncbi:MAG: TIGR03808 family TAT-translocated repetitive protein [Rhizobiaceae bacterium]|nr:TIGR03808 family TAT-translocated repetitive protein [Rhizobiaceae bacterium]